MIPPFQVVSYWGWPNIWNRSNNKNCTVDFAHHSLGIGARGNVWERKFKGFLIIDWFISPYVFQYWLWSCSCNRSNNKHILWAWHIIYHSHELPLHGRKGNNFLFQVIFLTRHYIIKICMPVRTAFFFVIDDLSFWRGWSQLPYRRNCELGRFNQF